MTVVSHEPLRAERTSWMRFVVAELWASLTIAVIWLAVLFTAVYGPDIVSSSVAGDHVTVPSVVVVSLFAFLATWAVAAFGFRRRT
jgi:ABC-type multidrug transport system fused ATPase/permease subunit